MITYNIQDRQISIKDDVFMNGFFDLDGQKNVVRL